MFIQAFGPSVMDSALLLLAAAGFVEYGDERMVRTVDAVRKDLEGGLLPRWLWEVRPSRRGNRGEDLREGFNDGAKRNRKDFGAASQY